MSSIRAAVTHFLIIARGETRLALTGAPDIAWRALGVFGWGLLAVLMGSVVGYAAATLPPMGLLAILMVFALVLLWVLPDGPTPPDSVIRQLLFIVVIVDLTIPAYYTVQFAGLPWISARRICTFALIVLFSIAYSTSKQSRQRIGLVVRCNKVLFGCAAGFLMMVFVSIFTSKSPLTSLSGFVDVILVWYVPFIAVVHVIRKAEDVEKLLILICFCAIIVALMGIIEYAFHHRIYIDLMPKSLVNHLAANNPAFAQMMQVIPMRNGQYRAASLFSVSLSFAEFEAMVTPLAAIFMFYGRTLFKRLFGAVVLIFCCAGIFVSGSRGGYLSVLVASASFASLLVVRSRLLQPRGFAWPIFGLLGAAGSVMVGIAIVFVGRIHRVITGGYSGAISDDGRKMQWALAWPHILSNPITGNGYGLSGAVIGWTPYPGGPTSVDSYVLSLLVDAGLPAVLFFFGMTLLSAWTGARLYLRDPTWAGALSAGLASSLVAFSAYRLFLSQVENMTLMFMMVACVALLHSFFERAKEQRASGFDTSPPNPAQSRG